jgi:hypothetical protein
LKSIIGVITSIDPYLDRMPRNDYNCLDFVREVWLGLFNDDVKRRLDALCAGVHSSDGVIKLSGVKGFEKLDAPISPCFVVMQRSRLQPHIGIFYNNRILHLRDNGVEYQPLQVARRYFTKIGYYR